jgi:hypothetical protein
MGFFSKAWKSVKKVIKKITPRKLYKFANKIGKGIRGAFQKFGKFMGKIGILGQAAMMFIMPGVGAMLGNLFQGVVGVAGTAATATTAATAGSGLLGSSSALLNAAGNVLKTVGNVVSKGRNIFSNITKGVTETLGNFAKTASNKVFGTSFDAASNFFGSGVDSAWSRSTGELSRFKNLTEGQGFFDKIKDATGAIAEESAKTGAMPAYDSAASRVDAVRSQINLPEAAAVPEGSTMLAGDIVQNADVKGLESKFSATDLANQADTLKTFSPEQWEDFGFTTKGLKGDVSFKINGTKYYTPELNFNRFAEQQNFSVKAFKPLNFNKDYSGSLLSQAKTAIVEAPKNLGEKAIETVSSAPADYLESEIQGKIAEETAPTSLVPDIYNDQSSTVSSVPSFGQVQIGNQNEGFGLTPNSFEVNQNYSTANQSGPWGYTQYLANTYGQRMQSFGTGQQISYA